MLEQAKLQEVTGKPKISHKSHSMSRDVKDLYNWSKDVQKKKQDLLRQKEEEERQEIEKHMEKAQKYVNKESARYLQNKENLFQNQKIEERLISIGMQHKLKREIAAKQKIKEEMQKANEIHSKSSKISDKYLMKSKKHESPKNSKILTEKDLKQISANKERKDLFQKYFIEKKREAESRLLSTSIVSSA